MRNKKTDSKTKTHTHHQQHQARAQSLDKNAANEKPGELFSAHILAVASDGRGVASHDSGRRYFIPGVWEGEKITARITEIKGSVGFAECVEINEPSPQRIEPVCPHHGFDAGECGGCPWQFMSYEAQLAAKNKLIRQAFSRLLGVHDLERALAPIHASPKIFAYRNRAQFKSDGKQLGYISPLSNELAPIAGCAILSEKNQTTLSELLQALPNPEWRPGKKHPWVSLDIDETVDAASVSVNQRLPFMQGNSEQNAYLKNLLADQLSALDKNFSVLELFCGSGNLTEVIAAQGFAKVIAADVVPEAMQALQARNLAQVEAVAADLFTASGLNAVLKKAAGVEVLVLDPPREGLKEKGALFGKNMPFQQVFYVSCDLATLVRDVALFIEAGYKIRLIQPLDFFPHTPHVELLVSLRKRQS